MSRVDELHKTLGDLGFVGALPDRMYNHLFSLGYTGAMNDRFSKEGGYKAYISGILLGDYSGCNVYLFSAANSDSLEIESFTGNLKVMIAAPSEVGINPAIVAGRQGDFVASAGPVDEPSVVQYEIEASAITQVVSSAFNGVVYKYAKDNVWYKINMGVV